MYAWQSFEYHDMSFAALAELYVSFDAEFFEMETLAVL